MKSQNRTSCQKKIDEEEKLIYTIYIPGQKKLRVAKYDGSWIKWLEDKRVNFKRNTANRYIKIYEELGDSINRGIIDSLSLNKLYTLASAPEEVKEEYQ